MDLSAKKASKTIVSKKLKTNSEDESKRTVNEVESCSSESSSNSSSDSSDEEYLKKRKRGDRKKKSKKSKKSKCILITETISTIEAKIGICPECRNDDESEMIGCDKCNDWFHYRCAGITVEPKDEDSWFCKKCTGSESSKKR